MLNDQAGPLKQRKSIKNVKKLNTEASQSQSIPKGQNFVKTPQIKDKKNQKGNGSYLDQSKLSTKRVCPVLPVKMCPVNAPNQTARILKTLSDEKSSRAHQELERTKDEKVRYSQIILDNYNKSQINNTSQSHRSSLTEFEKDELIKFDLFYSGPRRIQAAQEFTGDNGEANIYEGDSIAFRFQIVEEIGRGSFGKVYKAFDHKRNEIVALKIMKKQEKLRKLAKVEVKLLKKCKGLNGNYIVDLKFSCIFRGHPCLVFELMGFNLYQLTESTNFLPLHIQVLKRISVQILQGLFLLEQNKIIHCDLKPENIMVNEEGGNIKIIDFGSGCFESEKIYHYIQSRYYRAPEVIMGIPYSFSVDMWSFGCICVELLLGEPLFFGKNDEEQLVLMIQTLGLPPYELVEETNFCFSYLSKEHFIDGQHRKPYTRPLSKILGNFGDSNLVDFIERILKWDPTERMNPMQALHHPFLSEYLDK